MRKRIKNKQIPKEIKRKLPVIACPNRNESGHEWD